MKQFDVIVIGGGPAGVAAAITCLQGGIRPLLITDRPKQIPDNKGQTEPLQSLHPGAQSLISQLHIGGAVPYASRGTYTGIRVGDTVSPLSTVPGETWTGNHIAPGRFATYTIQMAQLMDVDVLFGSRVSDIIMEDGRACGIILTDGTKINCNYLIDASGLKRFAGRYLNFEEQIHSQPLICYTGNSIVKEGDHRDKETAIFTPAKFGWTWEAFSSFGYYTWTKLAVKNTGTRLNMENLAEDKTSQVRGGDMQWRVFRQVVCPGMLMVGDAAGVLDPAAGQGILNGLLSGIMGAETVIKCIQQPLMANWYLTQYDSWYIDLYHKKAGMLKKKYLELGIAIH